jgi:hypothetical protein
MALDTDDQKLLAIVLETANGNLKNLPYGLDKAMEYRARHRAKDDLRNYGFVRRLIEKTAKRKIREANKPKELVLT